MLESEPSGDPLTGNDILWITFVDGLLTALAFAAERHSGQLRKGATHGPYINHPIRVLMLLWDVGGVRDLTTLVAALLHDLVEDTGTPLGEIEARFGEAVADIVRQVTDDKSLPKATRKRLQIEHAPMATTPAKLVKLADKIHNVMEIGGDPPAGWSTARRAAYLDWAEAVVAGLRGVSPALEAVFDAAVTEARAAL
jgi:GTP diphosphokinase / guanosine-3',5'-bis(diphosphate) 3'-diphosphatase